MPREMWNCPFCGFELDKRATSCPQCGSDEETGWNDNSYQEELEHSYEAALKHEFEMHDKVKKDWKAFLVTILVVGSLIGIIVFATMQ